MAQEWPHFRSRIANSVAGIVFLGTPHHGMDIRFAKAFLKVTSGMELERRLAEFLAPNSAELFDIAERFQPVADKYTIATFVETRKTRVAEAELDVSLIHASSPFYLVLFFIFDTNTLAPKPVCVVGATSATLSLPNEIVNYIDGDHISMCKFDVDDERLDMVYKVIKLMIA